MTSSKLGLYLPTLSAQLRITPCLNGLLGGLHQQVEEDAV